MEIKTDSYWLALTEADISTGEAIKWASIPSCGAVVSFLGNARNNSKDRDGVSSLDYEAYEDQVLPRLEALAQKIQTRWNEAERIVLHHRTGTLEVSETAVLVIVASPHREVAFEAAKYGIDTLKETIPIWKKEVWKDGESWGLEAQHIQEI